MIVVDNVLWKGLVLDAMAGGVALASDSDSDDDDLDGAAESAAALKRNKRARKLANKMHRFNQAMAVDDRVEVLVLPFRDGLSVIRKK
jgi:predicted O-methyltransferase YrrM